MSTLKALVERAVAQQARVAELEATLQAERHVLTDLLENAIPERMEADGVKRLKLATGVMAELETSYHAAITKVNKDAALRWLIENGYMHLIKRQLTVQFRMGALDDAQVLTALFQQVVPELPVEVVWRGAEDTQAAELQILDAIKTVLGDGHGTVFTDEVHAQSLKAFVKKQFERGVQWPAELFNAFRRIAVKLTLPIPEEPGEAERLQQQLQDSLVAS